MLRVVLLALFCLSCYASQFSVFEISNYGNENLERLKSSLENIHDCEWWIEIGDKLLAYSSYPSPNNIKSTGEPVFIVSKAHTSRYESLSSKVLLQNLGFAIIQASEEEIEKLKNKEDDIDECRPLVVEEFNKQNIVLVKQVDNLPLNETNSLFQEVNLEAPAAVSISVLVNAISQPRWFSDVQQLATYNRYTKGTGIAGAQKWIMDQLSLLKNLTVTTQPFTSGSTSGVNIIATLKGTTTPNNWVIIGGHYDSTSQSPTTLAPGAEDDASGSAAVLEMARIFNSFPSPSTAIFIFFSGEEQGLYGSAAHAQSLVNSGDASKVKLMHNMDMIAYQKTASAQNQVILETTSDYSSLFPLYRESGARYTKLGLFESTTAWGSDHESYIKRNMPGLLTIDKDWDTYPSYHKTTDTPDKLNPTLGYEIIKLGVGAIAQALGYPF